MLWDRCFTLDNISVNDTIILCALHVLTSFLNKTNALQLLVENRWSIPIS